MHQLGGNTMLHGLVPTSAPPQAAEVPSQESQHQQYAHQRELSRYLVHERHVLTHQPSSHLSKSANKKHPPERESPVQGQHRAQWHQDFTRNGDAKAIDKQTETQACIAGLGDEVSCNLSQVECHYLSPIPIIITP